MDNIFNKISISLIVLGIAFYVFAMTFTALIPSILGFLMQVILFFGRILKIENKKEIKNKINIETELEKRILFLQNAQLNQFSNIYFMKIKKDFLINEK